MTEKILQQHNIRNNYQPKNANQHPNNYLKTRFGCDHQAFARKSCFGSPKFSPLGGTFR